MQLEEIRKKYPEYNDLSDEELVRSFHKKYYSDIPLSAVSKRLGLKKGKAMIPGYKPTKEFPEPKPRQKFDWDKTITTMKEDLKEHWPEMAGATVGAIAGTPGGVPGMVVGAVVGGAAGKAGQQLYEYKYTPTKSPKTSWEAAKEIGKAATVQGAYELIGGAAAKGVTKALAPFGKRITAEGRIAFEALNQYMPKAKWTQPISRITGRRMPGVLPAEATESRALDILHNIGEASIIGGERVADFKKFPRAKAIEDMIDDLASAFSKSADADAIGHTVTKLIDHNWKSYRKALTDPLYHKVDEMTEGIQVPIKQLKDFLQPIKTRIKNLKGLDAINSGDEIVRAIDAMPEFLEYGTAQELRSRLISIAQEFSVSNPKAPAIGITKYLTKTLDKNIAKTLEQTNPEALMLWRQANDLYKVGAAKYNNYFLRKLMSAADPKKMGEPEKVVKMIFRNRGISGIRKVKSALGEKQWNMLQGWYFGDLIAKSVNPQTGELIGSKLLANMYGKSGMGTKEIAAIFSKQQITQIDKIATTLKVLQGRQGEGTGRMFIQLTQAGAFAGVAGAAILGHPMPATAGAIIFGPYVVARMMLNPITARWLMKGVKVPLTARLLPATSLRIINAADRTKELLERESIIGEK